VEATAPLSTGSAVSSTHPPPHVLPVFLAERDAWLRGAASLGIVFGTLAWSSTTPPVAAKYRMTSVRSFLLLESAFTALQFVIVSPLIAWAWRDAV
jgi:hypothetical protein